MKRLLTNNITSSIFMPIKSGTLEFLQDANKEVLAAIIQGMIGVTYSTSIAYRLFGADMHDDGGDNWGTTAGFLFFNGEVYPIDAVPYSPGTFLNVFGLDVIISNFGTNADPVEFSNTATHNVHNIRKLHFVDGGAISSFTDIPLLGTPAALAVLQALGLTTPWVDESTNPTIVAVGGGNCVLNLLDISKYKIIGKTMIYQLVFSSTISGTVTQINITPAIYGAGIVADGEVHFGLFVPPTGSTYNQLYVISNTTYLAVAKLDNSAFTTGVGNLIRLSVVVELP